LIPIRDTIRARYFPLANWILISANAVIFFLELTLSPAQLAWVIQVFGLVPENIRLSNPLTLLPFITHMFLHGGWIHFLSNVWVLYIFGDNVEDRLGSARYLAFYLLGGIFAGVLQTLLATNPGMPSIGASGAIAAVMGAYFLFFPRARVITLVPIFLVWFIEIPAVFFLGFWFITQLFSGILSSASMQVGGVAWWAHVGGFIFGLVTVKLFEYRRPRREWFADEYYPW
jgi:membrane associated rhomboid family serine protease